MVVYPVAKRTGTQANTGVSFCYRRTAVDQYPARTLSNRHRYMHVIRETDMHLDL